MVMAQPVGVADVLGTDFRPGLFRKVFPEPVIFVATVSIPDFATGLVIYLVPRELPLLKRALQCQLPEFGFGLRGVPLRPRRSSNLGFVLFRELSTFHSSADASPGLGGHSVPGVAPSLFGRVVTFRRVTDPEQVHVPLFRLDQNRLVRDLLQNLKLECFGAIFAPSPLEVCRVVRTFFQLTAVQSPSPFEIGC